MVKRLNILTIIILISASSFAQENWSLNRCIAHAKENNINLNIIKNRVKSREASSFEAKANLFPSLNAGSGIGANWGRNIDGNTNQVTYDRNVNNNFWIESSMTFFQGFVKYNNISYNNYMLKASIAQRDKEENDLVLNVLSAYYKVIYSKELENVAKNQVDLSENLLVRMEKMVEVGRESQLTLQELKSQWAKDKLTLSRASNNTTNSILEIKQLLRLNQNNSFDTDSLDLQLFSADLALNTDTLFNIALEQMPEIKQQAYALKASKKSLAMSRGYISPRLSLSASIATNYFDGNPSKYNEQINNNISEGVYANLTIPIFNGASSYSKIKRSKIDILEKELLLEKTKDDLYANISFAVNDLESAKNEYFASIELHEYSKLTLENITKKMEKGIASTSDLDLAKQRYIAAEAELIRSKLMYVIKKHTLEFYKNGNWEHMH